MAEVAWGPGWGHYSIACWLADCWWRAPGCRWGPPRQTHQENSGENPKKSPNSQGAGTCNYFFRGRRGWGAGASASASAVPWGAASAAPPLSCRPPSITLESGQWPCSHRLPPGAPCFFPSPFWVLDGGAALLALRCPPGAASQAAAPHHLRLARGLPKPRPGLPPGVVEDPGGGCNSTWLVPGKPLWCVFGRAGAPKISSQVTLSS